MYDDAFFWAVDIEPMQKSEFKLAGDRSGLWRVVGRLTGNNSGKVSQTKIFGEDLTLESAQKLQSEKHIELNSRQDY